MTKVSAEIFMGVLSFRKLKTEIVRIFIAYFLAIV
jgi:hypothetical protein